MTTEEYFNASYLEQRAELVRILVDERGMDQEEATLLARSLVEAPTPYDQARAEYTLHLSKELPQNST